MLTQSASAAETNHPVHETDDTLDNTIIHLPWAAKPTPLPIFQIFLVFLIQFAEPLTASVVYPFINQFVKEIGATNEGDERKTGHYAGIIGSSFFFTEAFTVIQWGYLSDRFGRRPILLLGPLGLAASMLTFGASTSFVPLVLSRCFQGVFSGNIGVAKSMIVEMTDSSNIGDAYALYPLMWTAGSTLGPLIGGALSDLATRWPDTLGQIQYLREHPYFVPCATAGFIAFVTFKISFFGLKETLPSLVAAQRQHLASDDIIFSNATAKTPLINHREGPDYGATHAAECPQSSSSINFERDSPRPERHAPPFLTLELLAIYLNLGALSFLEMGHCALLPLFYFTSIPSGGLGLDPLKVGMTFGSFGFIRAVIQATIIGPLIRKYGARQMYIMSFPGFFACFTLYPVMRYFAQLSGRVDGIVTVCMIIQLSFDMCVYAAYGFMQVILAQHAADCGRMGTVVGIGQMVTSGMRSISLVFVSSLFSISSQKHLTDGNLVFYILMGMTVFVIRVSHFLPHPPSIEKKK